MMLQTTKASFPVALSVRLNIFTQLNVTLALNPQVYDLERLCSPDTNDYFYEETFLNINSIFFKLRFSAII